MNQWPLVKDTIKVEDTQVRSTRVEILHSLDYFIKKIAQDLHVNMSFNTG